MWVPEKRHLAPRAIAAELPSSCKAGQGTVGLHKRCGLLNSTDSMLPSALRLDQREEILVSLPPL